MALSKTGVSLRDIASATVVQATALQGEQGILERGACVCAPAICNPYQAQRAICALWPSFLKGILLARNTRRREKLSLGEWRGYSNLQIVIRTRELTVILCIK
jgi:hypothetical protein